MSLRPALTGIFILLTIFAYSTLSQPTQQCLDCICQASTGCDLTKKCHNAGPGAYYCGPYQISWSYWSDAGKPGSNGEAHDFENCLNNRQCAEQTVIGFMSKWARDCNGDGVINCADFAAIHKAGPHSCTSSWLLDTEYWKIFQSSSCAAGSSAGSSVIFTPPSRIIPFTEDDIISNSNRPQNAPMWTAREATPNRTIGRPLGQPTLYRTAAREVSSPVNNYQPSINNQPPIHEVFGSQPISIRRSSSGSEPPAPMTNSVPDMGAIPNQPTSSPVNTMPVEVDCLQCLCQASTGCDSDKQCIGSVCGPYLISWPYWSDAGRHGTDYVSCALNTQCAEATVQGYISRFKRDCNGDGVIDCDDYALIHKYGLNCGPGTPSNDKFWNEYRSCRKPSIDARGASRPLRTERSGQSPPFTMAVANEGANPTFNGNNRSPNEIPHFYPVDRNPNSHPVVFHRLDERRPTTDPFSPIDQPKPLVSPFNDSIYFDDARYYNPPASSPNSQPMIRFQPVMPSRVGPPMVREPPLDRPTINYPNPLAPRLPSSYPNPLERPVNREVAINYNPIANSRPTIGSNTFNEQPSFDSYGPENPSDQPSGLNSGPNVESTPITASPFDTNSGFDSKPTSTPTLPPSPSAAARREAAINRNSTMSEECLGCICEATTRCDVNYPCLNTNGVQTCGPYQISISYWLAAGKPGYKGGSSDFINCVTNDECARKTVNGYISSMSHDCNKDGVVDCVDYAAIHRLGKADCEDQAFFDSTYWNDFQACYGFERR